MSKYKISSVSGILLAVVAAGLEPLTMILALKMAAVPAADISP